MKYIRPEIEINVVHVEDIMAISDAFNWIVGGDSEDENAPTITQGSEGEANLNVGADFFG
ncbi:MAG: hypothetical protein J6A54_04360 [Clostridia bacterium]|nr:hypothetical protein [Clostridia bacterium]